MTDKPIKSTHRRRGIYLLPNLLTTAGLFAGFYAIVQAMNGNFVHAPVAIILAMAMDGLDGRIARWTHTESDFGAEYDSLADLVSFGLAPALVMYAWALQDLGKLGSLTAFLFAVCAALRLARFNTQHAVTDRRYFRGLASPPAAALVVSVVWVVHAYQEGGEGFSQSLIPGIAVVATLLASVLMVSNIRYQSFKDLDLKGRVPFMTILAVPLVIVLVMMNPPVVLFMMAAVYALSGPVAAMGRWLRRSPVDSNKKDPHNL